eukprot:TRINITY_DN7334_c0_g1_i1.p1 TRINITY_DN7334_c0_g1~~TRINITY_DN7334_c0_g1_i1.p1  ORF type:complete len:233 (-),score=4.56 TRINITY_DN7334_c0_g1_i1:46-744(-)
MKEEVKYNLPSRSAMHPVRKIWHALAGLTISLSYYYLIHSHLYASLLYGLLFVGYGGFEYARINFPEIRKYAVALFGPFLRVHEVSTYSGSFYFMLGTFITVLLYSKPVAVLSLLYVALGDPVASAVGIYNVERNQWRLSNGKSLLGTFACFVVCFLVSIIFFSIELHWFSLGSILLYSVTASIVASLAELVCPIYLPTDDNFLIPVTCGAFLTILSFFLQTPFVVLQAQSA